MRHVQQTVTAEGMNTAYCNQIQLTSSYLWIYIQVVIVSHGHYA